MRRRNKLQEEWEGKADFDQQEAEFLADPSANCQTMWTPQFMAWAKCQRPIAQSVPHQHRALERHYRIVSEWAKPGNYHNNFEKAAIEADTRAWLEEPNDRYPVDSETRHS